MADFRGSLQESINNIGVRFTNTLYSFSSPFSVDNFAHVYTNDVITDTANWVTIFGSFLSDSTYQYIMVGNFFTAGNFTIIPPECGTADEADYFLDDICVSMDSLTCNATDAIFENNTTSNFINIFPNPATNEIILDFTMTDKGFFELYDVIGAKRMAVTLDSGSKTKRVNLADFDSGLYFYSVFDSNGDKIKTDKLIIIK